jgi:hypothetical protein
MQGGAMKGGAMKVGAMKGGALKGGAMKARRPATLKAGHLEERRHEGRRDGTPSPVSREFEQPDDPTRRARQAWAVR